MTTKRDAEKKQGEFASFFDPMWKAKELELQRRIVLRNKTKALEIGKYLGLYILVYVIVLAVCGLVQYTTVCNGYFTECVFQASSFNTIITTTAYVVTPMVAIIGFLSWKGQHNRVTISQMSQRIYGLLDELNLLLYKYGGCISDQYDATSGERNPELLNKMNQVFAEINLLSKLTSSNTLDDLNESNRVAVFGIVFDVSVKMAEGVDYKEILKSYRSKYSAYSDVLKSLRHELSFNILV